MGGGASIEACGHLNIDYATLKSSRIDFASAYDALEIKLEKRKSENAAGDLSIPFLAIRQLSHNLRDQETLEKTKTKGTAEIYGDLKDAVEELDNAEDLLLVPDVEYGIPASPQPKSNKPKSKLKPSLTLKLDVDCSIETNATYSTTYVENDRTESEDLFSDNTTVRFGELKILETGILPDTNATASPLFDLTDISKSRTLPALCGKEDFMEIATLGSGASGVVCEAIHVPTMTLVALKMLPIYNQEKKLHVARELAILYKNLAELKLVDESLQESPNNGIASEETCSCNNILSLYNAFVDPNSGMINLVIEYMDGGSLEDLVKRGGCRDEQVLSDISRQSLNGLSFLHVNNYMHRDIKPANILCSSSGAIKIADFGISKALDKSTGFTHSFIGTVCYMSPERINHEFYNFSSDIWSLGLTLLTVAEGKFPLIGKEEADDKSNIIVGGPKGFWTMIQAICDQDPPVAGPSYSANFNKFISTCLQKDPSLRGTADQLLQSSFILHQSSTEGISATILIPTSSPNQDNSSLNNSLLGKSSLLMNEEHGDEEGRIIYAIRMEHLERILTKMSQRISNQKLDAVINDNTGKNDTSDGSDSKLNAKVDRSRKEVHVRFDHQTLLPEEKDDKRKSRGLKLWDVEVEQDVHFNKRANSFGQPVLAWQKTAVKTEFPRFDKDGLQKWKNLSLQLHIPLPIILIAARAKLGHLIDLDTT